MKVLAIAGDKIILQANKEEVEKLCGNTPCEGQDIEIGKMYDSIINVSMMGTDADGIAKQLRKMADDVVQLALLGTQVRA